MLKFPRLTLSLLLALIYQGSAYAQFGPQLTGVGAINRSMGGAATAAPLDTLGAFQWNPATITALPSSTDFSLEAVLLQAKLSSSIGAGSLFPGFPPATISGSDHSGSGAVALPEWGFVCQPDDSPLSYGVGLLTVAGFGANYPGDLSNPILSKPPIGVGPIYSQYALMQIVPTVAIQATDHLSIGFSPIVDVETVSLDPGVLASPNLNGTYPALTHGTYQWGAGFQFGLYYVTDSRWQFGAAFKSPQWFNSLQYNTVNSNGVPRSVKFVVDAPMIVSIGGAYAGFDRLLLALDMRYIDYANTRPFNQVGFAPSGAITGVGWDSIFALSTGAQYQVSDRTSVRLGYSFGTNPVCNNLTFFNVASPVICQHGIYGGFSYNITERFKFSLAYSHFFANSISGPFQTPLGPIPGTNVTSRVYADAITAGASFLF